MPATNGCLDEGAPSSVIERRPLFSNLVASVNDEAQHTSLTKAIVQIELLGMAEEFWTNVGHYRRITWAEEVRTHEKFRPEDVTKARGASTSAKRTIEEMVGHVTEPTTDTAHLAGPTPAMVTSRIAEYMAIRTHATSDEVEFFLAEQAALDREEQLIASHVSALADAADRDGADVR